MPEQGAADRVVTFLIIGVQKAGTTALHHFLRQHPDLHLPSRKELHFFDRPRLSDPLNADYAAYERKFRGKKEGQLAGEATPIYSYWPGCMTRIRSYNPDMKLVMCLRNPAERAFSHWAMSHARGTELMSFADAIRKGRQRVARRAGGHHRDYSYVERGFYAEQISRVLARFPSEQLLVRTFEELQQNRDRLLDSVCRFLQVPRFAEYPPNQQILPTVPRPTTVDSLGDADRAYLQDIFRDDIREAQRLTGLDLSAWLTDG